MTSKMPLEQIALEVGSANRPHLMSTAIIAVDGCGGAGISTFAGELSKLLGICSVIHADDFPSWDNPLNWFKRMLDEVLLRLKENKPAHFRDGEAAPTQWLKWMDEDDQYLNAHDRMQIH